MKIIFLDVEGVLVHSDTVANGHGQARLWEFFKQIDTECMNRLVRVIKETGAKVVISSSWRKYSDAMAGLTKAFRVAGAPDRRSTVYDTTGTNYTRSIEISDWLDKHPEVTKYVVLDDSYIERHLMVQVANGYYNGGLQDKHVEQLISALK